MARLMTRGDELIVRLAWWEKIVARHGDVHVPLGAVTTIVAEPSWWRVLRGAEGRGVWVPDVLCVGEREVSGLKDFVAIRPRQRAAVCVELRPAASPFARIAVSDRVPDATAATLRTALSRHGKRAPTRRGPGGAPLGGPVPRET